LSYSGPRTVVFGARGCFLYINFFILT
jgi:hypothetical protein